MSTNLQRLFAIAVSSRLSSHLFAKLAHMLRTHDSLAAPVLQSSRALCAADSRALLRCVAADSAAAILLRSKSSRDRLMVFLMSETSGSDPHEVSIRQVEKFRSKSESCWQLANPAPHLLFMHSIMSRLHSAELLRTGAVAAAAKLMLTFAARHDCSISGL